MDARIKRLWMLIDRLGIDSFYLVAESLFNKEFRVAFHWPMIHQAQQFYVFITDFIVRIEGGIDG